MLILTRCQGDRCDVNGDEGLTVVDFGREGTAMVGVIGRSEGQRDKRCVEFRSVFRAPSRKFKILPIPDVLAHGKSYEHGFDKKCDGHKLCAKSRAVKFRSVFRAPSRKFKILAIPDVLGNGKLYEHGFAKKLDGHILCVKSRAESSFDRFYVDCLGNSKYWPFPTY
ncbi:hypothetical protein BHM03_00046317 [Ensete ventricosum]|nr:hypothetical protein BHM03_00046317 [Ensete ventricosum]